MKRLAARSRSYVFWGVLWLGLLVLTWAGRGLYVAHVARTVEARQHRAVSQAYAWIEQEFAGLQEALAVRARAVAEAGEVVRTLRRLQRDGDVTAGEHLVRVVAALELPERTSVEVYDPMPRRLAWNGFAMPMDDAPASSRFLEDVQVTLARDGDKRAALVVWWPVREGTSILGVVRAMRLIAFDAPVRNRYLRDYSLADEWTRSLRLPVRVRYADATEAGDLEATRGRLLQGLDGTPLLWVFVEPPVPEQLVDAAGGRVDDLIAGWATLFGFWLVAGLWGWYRAGTEKDATAWGTRGRRFTVLALAWWGLRYAMLALDVPGRWQQGKAPLAPLFDPQHLASTFGGGLMQSIGDLLLTALFALVFSGGVIHLVRGLPGIRLPRRSLQERLNRRHRAGSTFLWGLIGTAGVGLLIGAVLMALAGATRHALLDSTLDFFARTGLLPERLVLLVNGALLMLTLSAVLLIVGVIRAGLGWLGRRVSPSEDPGPLAAAILLGTFVAVVVLYLVPAATLPAPWISVPAFLIVAGVGVYAQLRAVPVSRFLLLRNVLPQVFVLALLLYPFVYSGLDMQRRLRMEDAAEAFREGVDPRVFFAIEQVLQQARQPELVRALARADTLSEAVLDSLAWELVRGSLLLSLGNYDISLTLLDALHRPRGRYQLTARPLPPGLRETDSLAFDLVHAMYLESGQSGPFVQRMTGRRQRDRYQYVGLVPVPSPEGTSTAGWVFVRVEPDIPVMEGFQALPRVLLPAGFFGTTYADLSMAEFRDGVLVRSQGRSFGRYRLDETVKQALAVRPELWRSETFRDQRFLTYYQRIDTSGASPADPPRWHSRVVAVRTTSVNLYDHLYFLLRLTMAGLFIGLPIYLIGWGWRWRSGSFPARRVAFRDKVLNAFFAVGFITATLMGIAGMQVVTGESDRAIRSWLEQHLERVESALARQARGDELPFRVLDRIRIDSLARQVGLDLNVYQDARLVASSRPQLVKDRLIDLQLPVEAYLRLYFDGFRFAVSREEVGSFTYMAGYRALPDEQGLPRYVVSVPTLPEQERIEEERARTVAYLFGSLLMLLLVVMLTAAMLASALARPIARLRAGLEAVARGRFERIPPVRTRDEIGELVESFNAMQAQLAESRRRLAQQERQLAWREMARQVAHEIKNPLTPMKLSVQHLQRAFDDLLRRVRPEAEEATSLQRFGRLLHDKATTLLEQIDALKRIADEFSTFARMPSRMMEPLDLNAVIREAVALMQEEAGQRIELHLHPAPLVLEADREELRRIYINLIKNALQAADERRPLRIEITTERRPGRDGIPAWAYSTVTDTGTGIPEDLRGKIFEPNFSTKTSGTGLGLAIVRKAVEDLHGEIGFETRTGVGTTFWIRLPLAE